MGKPRGKGMRRASMKRFSSEVINAGQGVDSRYIARFKSNQRSFGGVRQGPTIDINNAGIPLLPLIIHRDEIPPTRSHYTDSGVRIPGISEPKAKVRDKLHHYWASENDPGAHGWEDFQAVVVQPGKITRMWMYWSGHHFFFVHEKPWECLRSIIYSSRDNAIRAFTMENIAWIERLSKEQIAKLLGNTEKSNDSKV